MAKTVREWIMQEITEQVNRYSFDWTESDREEYIHHLCEECVDGWDGTDDPDDEENEFIKDRISDWVAEKLEDLDEEFSESEEQ